MMSNFLLELAKTIKSKKNENTKKSYTSFLLNKKVRNFQKQ